MRIVPKEWFRPRTYLHFDLPISLKKASIIVTDPILVAKHAFYPLIHYTIEANKIGKDPISKKVVSLPTKSRPISYPAHVDSHIYAYYSKILNQRYEEKLKKDGLSDSILAFRSLGKSNIDFALDAFNTIKTSGECCAVALDISGFFDSLDHDVLKREWCNLLQVQRLPKDHFNVFKSITKHSFVKKDELYKSLGISLNYHNYSKRRVCSPQEFREKVRGGKLIKPHKLSFGIPQGTPLSAMLSNIYMFDFDVKMKEFVNVHNGKYFRYCDDMLFIVPIEYKSKVESFAMETIQSLQLSVNPKKTEIRIFRKDGEKLKADKHLQYLGFMFNGEDIFIRSSSLARYSERMRRGVRLAKKTMIKYNNIRHHTGQPERPLFKRKLYSRYTHLGKRNFITYGIRAANKMESHSIRRQLKPLFKRFNDEINKD
ncbi:antiviral reverse transcriptase Drt2 [Vibrio splendidus]